MAANQLNGLTKFLHRVTLLPDGGGMTDGHLLGRYLAKGDEVAFEAVVRRHCAMVMGVCHRVLQNRHDAEDAFQATFLVLVRKAASIVPREMVGNWLYGVAYRTALEARKAKAKRREKERQVRAMPRRSERESEVWTELQVRLDQELSRLPDKYRVPVVLCDLGGKTRKEAARHLGWPEGTLSTRLARARVMLAKRLSRYRLTVSAGALAGIIAQNAASAAVPAPLLASTVKAATLLASGQGATAGVISAQVAALTKGVLKTMLLNKLKIVTAALLVISATSASVVGVAALSYRSAAAQEPVEKQPQRRVSKATTEIESRWKERLVIKPQLNAGDQIFAIAISPDGKFLATGQSSGSKVVEAATGKLCFEQQDLTLGVAFSLDGKRLATGHMAWVNLWDVATGRQVASLTTNKNVHSVVFALDGTLATAAEGISLWNGGALRPLAPGAGQDGLVYAVAFSPDGKQLASADGPDKSVQLWDVRTGKLVRRLKGHTKYAIAVAFSPDGKTVASAGGEGEIKLWDAATGNERRSLHSPTTAFQSLAFSPDGKLLAAAGGEAKTVELWKVETGEKLVTLTTHTKRVSSVAFSRDGRTLVTAGDDAVRIWESE